MSITYSECVSVLLVTQNANRMRSIVICALYGSRNFSTLSHKKYGFRGKIVILCKLCVLIFTTTFV